MTDWTATVAQAHAGLAQLTHALDQLAVLRDAATAEIAEYLRAESGVELDLDAIRATLTRPYTLIPVSEHEATLIHWRGVKLPIFGWVVKQEPAFTISRVARGMDLLTPFPDWLKREMGWTPPEHAAQIDGTRTVVRVTSGDLGSFKRKYGAYLDGKVEGGFKIRGGAAWIRLVATLVRDGILPYTPQPVATSDWDAHAESSITLRDYQQPFAEEFKAKGATFFNLPPGGGKTFLALYLLAHLKGPHLILAPSVILGEQWQARVKKYAPNADVTILTYASGKKALEREWTLTIFDEVQTLPADTFSKLAFLKTRYRIGLSASPWREDGRQYMIAALAGFPCSIRWAELIRAGVLKRPRVVIATVVNDAAKTAFTRTLLEKRRGGRALVFCDYLDQGQQLANALGLPFVSGETPHKFQRVQEAEACVVSRIADRGLDFEDLTLVVEVAFLGKSREQEAQRLGRLLHSQAKGEHYLLFTPQEAEKFRPRIFGIEAELAGEIDLEFQTIGNLPSAARAERAIVAHPLRRTHPTPGAPRAQTDVDAALTNSAVRKLIAEAEARIGVKSRGYVEKAIRVCWDSPVTLEELRAGKGISEEQLKRYKAGFREAQKAGLVADVGEGRFLADRAKIKKLVDLSERFARR